MKKKKLISTVIVLVFGVLFFSSFIYAEKNQISQEEKELYEKALNEWEQHTGLTAEEYYEAHEKWQGEKENYEKRVSELTKKYYGEEFISLEDLANNGMDISEEFIVEFQSIKQPGMTPEKRFMVPSPPELRK